MLTTTRSFPRAILGDNPGFGPCRIEEQIELLGLMADFYYTVKLVLKSQELSDSQPPLTKQVTNVHISVQSHGVVRPIRRFRFSKHPLHIEPMLR